MPGAIPASPGDDIAAEMAAAAAAAGVGGIPNTDIPIPTEEIPIPVEAPRRAGGVGSRGAVWVMGCWAAKLATAIAGAARERATVSSGISPEQERNEE